MSVTGMEDTIAYCRHETEQDMKGEKHWLC